MSHGGGILGGLVREEKPIWIGTFFGLVVIFILSVVAIALPLDFSRPGDALARVGKGFHDTWFYGFGTFFVILDCVLIVLFTIALIKVWPLRISVSLYERPSHGIAPKHASTTSKDLKVVRLWLDVLNRAKTGTPANMRLAILEADALIDYVLKKANYEGQHMSDRLSLVDGDKILSVQRVWDAHRLRNSIVHTPGTKLTVEETKDALTAYRDFLMEFGAI